MGAPSAVSSWVLKAVDTESAWWPSAAFGAWSIRRLGIIAAGAVVGTAVLAAGARAGGRRVQRLAALHASDSGTAMLEFTLVLPIALMIFLVVLQTSLLYEARFHVSLAAFRGARSAMVWTPIHYIESYPPVVPPPVVARAQAAAVWTCIPISGVYPSAPVAGDQASLSEQTWREYASHELPWLGERFIAQYRYARARTRVNVYYDTPVDPRAAETPEEQYRRFWQHREPINVTVVHDFQLRVPYAARILAEKRAAPGLYVAELSATHQLLNDYHRELPGIPGPGSDPGHEE